MIPICVYLYEDSFTERQIAMISGQDNYEIHILKFQYPAIPNYAETGKVMLYYIEK